MGLSAVRHKSDTGAIETVADLDRTIKVIGLLDLNVEQIEADLDVAVKTMRDKAQAQAKEIQAERAILFAMAKQFVASHRDELLKGKKTSQLNFGKTGYRQTQAKIPIPSRGKQEMEDLCDVVEFFKHHEVKEIATLFKTITIHCQRYLMQADLKPLPDDILKLMALKRIPAGEEFFLVADREKLTEVENG